MVPPIAQHEDHIVPMGYLTDSNLGVSFIGLAVHVPTYADRSASRPSCIVYNGKRQKFCLLVTIPTLVRSLDIPPRQKVLLHV